jgi:hypothetical protein
MANNTRIYVVRGPNKAVALVKASSQAQAVGHVVRNAYEAEVAEQDILVELASAGVKVELAGVEAAA